LRQLNTFSFNIGNGNSGAAPTPGSTGQDTTALFNSTNSATTGNVQGLSQGMNAPASQDQNILQSNMGNNANIQQLMMSQLQGMKGNTNNFMQNSLGGMGMAPGVGMRQLGLNNIPNNVLGNGTPMNAMNGGMAGINQQLLLQQQLANTGANGVNAGGNGVSLTGPYGGVGTNGLGAQGVNNLGGLMMQNQFLPQMQNGANPGLRSANGQGQEESSNMLSMNTGVSSGAGNASGSGGNEEMNI